MILNTGYFINIRRDMVKYYDSIKCRKDPEERANGTCSNFTLVERTAARKNWPTMKPCPAYPQNLSGRIEVLPQVVVPISAVDVTSPDGIRVGGWWEPRDCISRHSVAIIIPYMDRWRHLTTLLNYLHPFLKRQRIRHKIYVVEQYGNETFNKGSIMNAGFIEAMKDEIYHCFIFHDVDLIPENDQNMYSCPQMPRHLSVAVNELKYMLPYPELVGGVLAIRPEHYFKVNGYSNFFWGWGGEDDDMAYRLSQSGLFITRPISDIGRYTMIKHKKRKPSNSAVRRKLLATSKKRYRLEGLNSVQYKLMKKKELPWFTLIQVDVGKPHPSFHVYKTPGTR
ncbi:UNVERIFIED_CONTAM: hypothetical protein PYX00_002156 [Menopon gallinae]|uniref:Beta-1,4-N-acetylgalactosaminyltransferase n=1 Tax=Menopon gallinae TaxID=328185 RepID=A0AAW2IG54_9NEOP